ncbi:hypothetical protein [Flexivirga sp.]|uniref:hypothetical protein n=1 Tax=Flexivirga sp. TaxID=1962927 RepID=UPI003F7D3E3B
MQTDPPADPRAAEHDATALPAGRVLVLDERFVTSLDDQQLQHYLDALTRAASGAHEDVDELAAVLSEEFDRLETPMPPVQVKMIAEQLFGVQDAKLDIMTTGGDLLAQQDGVVGVPERPGSAGDPEHPDRPFIS